MQAVWAATDKKTIERMARKPTRVAAKFDKPRFTSSEDSSDSDLESNAPFLAVPPEFRPNTPPTINKNTSNQKESTQPAGGSSANIQLDADKGTRERVKTKTAPKAREQKWRYKPTCIEFEYVDGEKSSRTKGENADSGKLEPGKKFDKQGNPVTPKSQEPWNKRSNFQKNTNDKRHEYSMKEYSSSRNAQRKYDGDKGIGTGSTRRLNNFQQVKTQVFERSTRQQFQGKQRVEWKIIRDKSSEPKVERNTVDRKKKIEFDIKKNDLNLGQVNPRQGMEKVNCNFQRQKHLVKNLNHLQNVDPMTDSNLKPPTPKNNITKENRLHKNQTEKLSHHTEWGNLPTLSSKENEGLEVLILTNKGIGIRKENCSIPMKLVDSFTYQKNPYENDLIHFGKEVSDSIVGCHIALCDFLLIYKEWKQSRDLLLEQFQKLKVSMKGTSKTYHQYLNFIHKATSFATCIPHPKVASVAKVINVLISIFKGTLQTTNDDTPGKDIPDIILIFLRDKQNSEKLYNLGVQCNTQFQETTKKIGELHSFITDAQFDEYHKFPEILNFMKQLKDYKPKDHTFYRKLHCCYQDLLAKETSSYVRNFCEPIFLYESNAVDVIRYLDWQFTDTERVDVGEEVEEIQRQIQKDASTRNITTKVEHFAFKLINELQAVQRCVHKIHLTTDHLKG